jgi:hypothetical protein
VAKEICGETKGKRQKERETWWWSEEVKIAIAEKKKYFKEWQRERTEEAKQQYKEKARQAKRSVRSAKDQAWQEWCQEIHTTEGRQKMFRLAKQMRKEIKDTTGAKYIKDEAGNIKVEEEEIKSRWKRYFTELLNEENPYELGEEDTTHGPINCVTAEEIKKALKGMKKGKAPGPSGLSSDLLKAAGDIGVNEMVKICQGIQEREIMPEEWGDSLTIPIYKGKGDALLCGKYRGVRLLEHGMKVWEKVLEDRLKKIIKINECQFGFQQGKSTTDAIFILRQVQERYLEKKKMLYHVFVDLEKAFDRVPRETISWALRRQGVPESLVNQVMALYVGTRSRVKTMAGTSEEFDIGVGVHQGSALSPLLFITVMEEATREGRRDGLWELLYADDLVLSAETKEEAIEQFNNWKRKTEKKGLKINMEKTKVMVSGKKAKDQIRTGKYPCSVCNRGVGVNSILCERCKRWCHRKCSGLRNVNEAGENYHCPTCVRGEVEEEEEREGLEVNGGVLEEVDSFCYLGDMLGCEQGAERAVRTRISSAWNKWREIASLLVNQRIPLAVRGCIRPVLLYRVETWMLTKQMEELLEKCDDRMLRYMAG